MMDPLDFLLDSYQVILCSFVLFVLVLHMNLIKLDIVLDDLYW
jgi:hypothetical protein